MSETPLTKENWIIRGNVGQSSKAIWAHFALGCSVDFWPIPSDPSDFLRCYWLLKLAPAWESRLGELGARYEPWKTLAAHWGELKTMLLRAWPKSCESGEYENEEPARDMYLRMKELGL